MDVKGTILTIARQLVESLNAQVCTIRIPKEEKMKLVATYGVDSALREEEVDIAGTIVGEAFITGQIQNIPDITKDKRYQFYSIIPDDQKALLAIPLQFEDKRLGVAQVYGKEPFSQKQIALAQVLSQFAARIIYDDQFRRETRKSFLEIVASIIEGNTFEEISKRAAEQIVKNLRIERCTVYRVFKKETLWCEIAAGVPEKEHGIGLKEELEKHPDIQAVVETKKINIINDPEKNPLTSHFLEIVRFKKINSILYIPINEKIVLVIDATKEKIIFTEEEIEFCSDIGQILFLVWKRIQNDLQEFRDLAINPAVSIGGWSKRIMEIAKILNEEARKLTQQIPEKF